MGAEFRDLVHDRYLKFRDQLEKHGISQAYTEAYYETPDDDLAAIRFTAFSARNQTPGPDAGGVLELKR